MPCFYGNLSKLKFAGPRRPGQGGFSTVSPSTPNDSTPPPPPWLSYHSPSKSPPSIHPSTSGPIKTGNSPKFFSWPLNLASAPPGSHTWTRLPPSLQQTPPPPPPCPQPSPPPQNPAWSLHLTQVKALSMPSVPSPGGATPCPAGQGWRCHPQGPVQRGLSRQGAWQWALLCLAHFRCCHTDLSADICIKMNKYHI